MSACSAPAGADCRNGTGDIVNAGEIRFDNQTTQDAVLSRAVAKGDSPVTFHKLTTTNLTGQGGTINMRVRLDGSNTSDQLVINGGQATGKTWLAFTNVGNSSRAATTAPADCLSPDNDADLSGVLPAAPARVRPAGDLHPVSGRRRAPATVTRCGCNRPHRETGAQNTGFCRRYH
ncbi:pertactin-like passenger domain-containing protein [Escherichia coli]|nr:pertactin-like passenger domain-containing protein [Escherichia coli]WKB01973.1 pertactin-like passenger domain-containing protein [Escherichia coli]